MTTVANWIWFTGLLLAVGAVSFRWAVLARWPGEPGAGETRCGVASSGARAGLIAAVLLLAGVGGRLWAQLSEFRDPFEPMMSELGVLLHATSWGTAWMTQAVFALAALIAFAAAARAPGRIGWSGASIVALLLSFSPAFTGHAIGTESWTGLAVGSDGLHVLGGGVWLGTLAVIAYAVRRGRRIGAPLDRESCIGLIATFSPVALVAACAIGLTGGLAAVLHLDAVSSLWSSGYGRLILVKLALVAVVAGIGRHNWQSARDRLHRADEPIRLPRSVALELAAGALVVLVTAALAHTALPGE